jgi:hypothetical protein
MKRRKKQVSFNLTYTLLGEVHLLKFFEVMRKTLTGSVSEGSFSRNCTIQYAN